MNRRLFLCSLAASAVLLVRPLAPAAQESTSDGDGSPDAPFVIEIPDSVRTTYTSSSDAPLVLETQEVSARRVVREAGADRVEIGEMLIETRDGGSVADLGVLLPSTQLTVNSRGEALFLVRGAQERHLRVELDGIPLTVPWDERTDLGLLPLIGVGSVVAHRGVSSALDPPNTLAGRIEMTTRRRVLEGTGVRLQAIGGEAGAFRTSSLFEQRRGDWTATIALEHRRRDGFLLPGDADLEFHQDPDRRLRLNTDLRQSTLLTHFGRAFGDSASIALLLQASDAEKAIAPESHVADSRFWRYPETQRVLLGMSGEVRRGAWQATAAASLDFFSQDIDSYTDASYSTVDATERNDDRTLLARLRVDRRLGERWTLAARGSARNALHEDDQDTGGAIVEIEQNLVAAGAEASFRPRDEWLLRAGAGYEGATTPQTGDKPSRDGDHEPVLHAAVEFDPDAAQQFHVTASRRPRFVSMRELFSGALNRFAVNPDLGPEIQTLYELGWSRREGRWEVMANGFWTHIDGSIEQTRLEDGRRQRVNLDAVRSIGVELGLVWRPVRGVTVDWQYTEMRTRSEIDGEFDGTVADRPDRLTTLGLQYVNASGALVRGEVVGVGPRFSLDESRPDPDDPFTELDADVRVNLRAGWRHFGTSDYQGSEIFVRLDNVFDATTYSQVGLPESGRTLRVGARVDLGS